MIIHTVLEGNILVETKHSYDNINAVIMTSCMTHFFLLDYEDLQHQFD